MRLVQDPQRYPLQSLIFILLASFHVTLLPCWNKRTRFFPHLGTKPPKKLTLCEVFVDLSKLVM